MESKDVVFISDEDVELYKEYKDLHFKMEVLMNLNTLSDLEVIEFKTIMNRRREILKKLLRGEYNE